MKRLGIYSGTFGPIHKGHIGFALAAVAECALGEVAFLPERLPRGKQNVSDIAIRAEGIRYAIAPYAQLRLTVLETPRFTIDHTLPQLQELFPNYQLVLLIGSDVAETLRRWPGITDLLSRAELVIGLRHGDSIEEMTTLMRQLETTHGPKPRYHIIASPFARVASSHLKGIQQ